MSVTVAAPGAGRGGTVAEAGGRDRGAAVAADPTVIKHSTVRQNVRNSLFCQMFCSNVQMSTIETKEQ